MDIRSFFKNKGQLSTSDGERRKDGEQDAQLGSSRMERLPSSSTPSGDSSKKIKFSQSEVQTRIEEEVRSAVKKNETKLQNLEKAIQWLNADVDYESSIEKLETRVKMVTKKAEAVLAHMTKTQKKLPLASCVNVDVSRTNSQDFPVDRKDTDCMDMSRDVLQIMETTKKALKKMRSDKDALTAAIAVLSEDLLPPPPAHASPEFTECHMLMKRKDVSDGYHDNENNLKKFKQAKDPKTVRVKQECFSHDGSNSFKHTGLKQNPLPSHVNVTLVRTHIKEETMEIVSQIDRTASKDRNTSVSQENENNFEEFAKLKECKSGSVKQEYPPPGDAHCSKHTHSGQEQDEGSFPPLPTTTFPSTMSIEAASYNMPRRLTVHLALIKQPAGLSVLWKVEGEEPSDPPMDSYSIYITMEKAKGCGVFTDWKTLKEVKAAPLPMYEWIPKYKPGHQMCVAVVGKDKFGRYGPYSKVVTAVIPE